MIQLTSLTPENLDGVARIEQVCFSVPWTKEAFQKDLDNENAVYFCIEEDGKVIGYVGMWNVSGEGNINNIAVLPRYRGRGYGKLLLESLIAYGKENNLSFLTLEVRESNQNAISLYRSVGFLEVGRRKKYYERTEDAILMTLTFS